ncbi:uncharacterized protein LOC111714327 [Eurytemora carolleeae]|uniref:uncharacterized protein LOC111714327 n=1 Tax=Eurytemora carolleeae TaxID=1294199 RepID=UPI000C75D3E1|nr:uncharacterized protein LOC111714327 [Eurytemora carolleeae]|eukprot:XP_023345177.1 uncharacterized protein LOC111714327 [Eurytemora affinis]
MVVFTSRDSAQMIRSLRTPKYPLHIIIQPLETLSVAQMIDSASWSAQEALDPEQQIGHSRRLYWIWNEKSRFLQTVSELNPFRSVYFAWLDIGALRHSSWNGELMMKRLPKEAGILLLGVGAFSPEELVIENGTSLADFSKVDRIGGGMFGGSLENVQKWSKMYYTTLKRYFLSSRFGGKDQSVMATTCLQSDICLILGDTPRWFLLQEYYMGRIPDEPKRLNLTK